MSKMHFKKCNSKFLPEYRSEILCSCSDIDNEYVTKRPILVTCKQCRKVLKGHGVSMKEHRELICLNVVSKKEEVKLLPYYPVIKKIKDIWETVI